MTSETVSAAPAAERPAHSRWPAILNFGLVLLIFFGITCRFYGLAWDDSRQLHPDERFLASTMARLNWPHGVGEYFDSSRSPLNPVNIKDVHYVYGQVPLLLGRVIYDLFHIQGDSPFMVYGRAISGFFDCLTILLTVLTGRRLLGTRAGLTAGALVALSALHIQQSHFYVVDTFAATFLALALWFTVRWLDTGRSLDAAGVGLAFGLALACKISAFLFGFALLPTAYFIWRRYGARRLLDGMAWSMVCLLVAFRVGHPMAFRGESGPLGIFDLRPETRFLKDLATQGLITNGTGNVPFNIQWIDRKPWLYAAENLAFWGYGLLFCAALAAGILLVVRGVRGRWVSPGMLVLTCFFAGVFLVQGAAFSKFTRYYVAVTGAGAIVASYALKEAAEKRRAGRWAAPVVLGGTAAWALAVTSIYEGEHTRIAATYWIRENVPPGTVVANETAWDEGLPLGWIPDRNGQGYNDGLEKLDLYAVENDDQSKRAKLLQTLNRSEWIFISSQREWASIPRWQARFPVMTEYYAALFDGRLGFRLEKEFHDYPRLGSLEFPDGGVEEALSVYDHPRVLLFRKTSAWSLPKARAILEAVPLPPQGQDWQPRHAGPVGPKPLPTPPAAVAAS